MAELNNGPLGSIRGKLGNMVASKWRDIRYLRAKGERSTKEATESQKEVQMKFNLMQSFMTRIKTVLEVGFQNKNTGRATALNLAVKKNMAFFTGVYPALQLDLPKLQISSGNLIQITGTTAELLPTGKLSLQWETMGNYVLDSAADDQVQVVVYNSTKNLHAAFSNVALRNDLQAELDIPTSFVGDELHIWVFLTGTGRRSSDSVYAAVSTAP